MLRCPLTSCGGMQPPIERSEIRAAGKFFHRRLFQARRQRHRRAALQIVRLVGGFFERLRVRHLLMTGERQPAVAHPHQDGSYFRVALCLSETETAIGFLLEVHLLRH